MDRISNLPNHVLELILDKLSVVDKVRTSALARLWRFKWTLVPSLEFNNKFYYRYFYGKGGLNLVECINIINGLLRQHRGPLRSFCLSIPISDDPINPALYDSLIPFVSRIPGLERLTIINEGLLPDCYNLPYSVFCAVGLTHLSLSCCELCPPPSFGGFPNLVSLHLGECTCTTNVITWIVSSCPQLQELKMVGLCFEDQTLHISASKLRYFSFSGSLGDIYLEEAEHLNKVDIRMCNLLDGATVGTSASTFQVFSNHCSKLCEISISSYVCKLACCGGLQTLPTFGRLKKLTFSGLNLDNLDVSRCVLSFLAHSPKLKALRMILNVEMENVWDKSEFVAMVEEYVVVGTTLGQLMEIEILNYVGTSVQMNMIELLLGISPVLQKMHIDLSRAFPLSLEKEQTILRKMLSFSRASGKAKIEVK